LIALRRSHPALGASAAFEPVYAEAHKYPFVYKRTAEAETALVVLNPAGRACEISLPATLIKEMPETLYGEKDIFRQERTQWLLRLPAVSGGLYLLRGS